MRVRWQARSGCLISTRNSLGDPNSALGPATLRISFSRGLTVKIRGWRGDGLDDVGCQIGKPQYTTHMSIIEFEGPCNAFCVRECAAAKILHRSGVDNDAREADPPDAWNCLFF